MEPGNKTAETMPNTQPTGPDRPAGSSSYPGFERPVASPEVGVRLNPETELNQARRVEAELAPIAAPGALPMPQAQTDDNASDDAVVSASNAPLVAADEDLIEKEWVDKAKKIIAETKDEPYRREQAVKQLQIEYVRKRYGRTIGDPGE